MSRVSFPKTLYRQIVKQGQGEGKGRTGRKEKGTFRTCI